MYTDGVRRALQYVVITNKKSTAAEVTAQLIDTIRTKIVRSKLHRQRGLTPYYSRLRGF